MAAAFSVLSGSQHHSFHQTPFHAAGRDMTLTRTVNINVTTSNLTVNTVENALDDICEPETSNATPASASTTTRSDDGQRAHCCRCSSMPQEGEGDGESNEMGKENAESSAQSSFVGSSDDISVLSIEDMDAGSMETSKITIPHVYIRSMLTSGRGLASWNPRPRRAVGERGIVPGDVGTFHPVWGFRKLFNLFEDAESIRTARSSANRYTPPIMRTVTYEEELPPGEPIVVGASAETQYTSDDEVSTYEFTILGHEGAVLVTSSADLEELENYVELRHFIVENAQLLYVHANGIRRLDEHESLYFLTGCIKSDSWAMAAFKGPIYPPHDVLRLIRRCDRASPISYSWTSRGTAEAKSGSNSKSNTSEYKGKDQCIFQHGFKLSFSSSFRSRMSTASTGSQSDSDTWGSHSDSDYSPSRRQWGGGGGSEGSSSSKEKDGGAGLSGVGSTSSVRHSGLTDEVTLERFPTESVVHPLDVMNRRILELTNEDFALTHDDDWRFALKNRSLKDALSFDGLESSAISICNGVAFLASKEEIVSACRSISFEPSRTGPANNDQSITMPKNDTVYGSETPHPVPDGNDDQ